MKRYLKVRENGFRNPVTGKLMPEYELLEIDYDYFYNYNAWFKKVELRQEIWHEDYDVVKKIHCFVKK